nr:transglycosylase domain-containing protein [Weissella cibaria]
MMERIKSALAWINRKIGPFWTRFQLTRWLIVAFLALIFVISAVGTFEAKTTDVSDLKARLQSSTEIYDVDDKKAGSIAGQKGTYVQFDNISSNVVNAVLATEDRNFYHEPGFSVTGMARGALTTIWYRIRGLMPRLVVRR